VIFDFKVTAPSVTDVFNFRWGMLREVTAGGVVFFFGDFTPNIGIRVGDFVEVPDVVHATPDRAQRIISEAGLVAELYGETNAPATYVASQSPDGGSIVSSGSTVRLRLVRGEPPLRAS
jgi:beta-lactam-binding protein with PASTA domain